LCQFDGVLDFRGHAFRIAQTDKNPLDHDSISQTEALSLVENGYLRMRVPRIDSFESLLYHAESSQGNKFPSGMVSSGKQE
jgi:hypothetical protein